MHLFILTLPICHLRIQQCVLYEVRTILVRGISVVFWGENKAKARSFLDDPPFYMGDRLACMRVSYIRARLSEMSSSGMIRLGRPRFKVMLYMNHRMLLQDNRRPSRLDVPWDKDSPRTSTYRGSKLRIKPTTWRLRTMVHKQLLSSYNCSICMKPAFMLTFDFMPTLCRMATQEKKRKERKK